MKSILSFLLLIYFTSFVSCNTKEVRYLVTNPQIKSSVTFKTGSYFIYKDSITGKVDSFWIKYVFQFYHETEQKNTIEQLGYYMINEDSVRSSVYTDGSGSGGDNYIIRGGLGKDVSLYQTNFDLNNLYRNGIGYQYFPKYFDSISILGNQHKNVLQSYSVIGTNKGDSISIVSYYSLSEGILKYSIKTDSSYHSWELVRNKIL